MQMFDRHIMREDARIHDNTLGEVIRNLRKRARLTQEGLAEGICSPVSISRIENGMQMPSSAVLNAILSRLGTSAYQLCNIYYKSDRQLAFEKQADHVTELMQVGKLEEAKHLLASLESAAKASPLNLQYHLMLTAALQLCEQNPARGADDMLKEALAITKPGLDYEDFRGVLLSPREANILSLLVVSLFRSGDLLSAIVLGEELASSLRKHQSTLKEYTFVRINVVVNLAQCLESEHRYSEALARCEEAESLSLETLEHALLPEIYFIKAKVLHLLGRDEESRSIFAVIVPYMELTKRQELAGLARAYAARELDMSYEVPT